MKQEINEMSINGSVYVLKSLSTNNYPVVNTDGLKAVLVRSKDAGVHFGFLSQEEFTLSGKVVTLLETRRVWYWSGAASLSQMALEGVKNPDKCKFSVVLASNEIVNVIETITLTPFAFENLKNVKIWKV